MKLLLDSNLAPRLASLIEDLFPGSAHVSGFGLGPDDSAIWDFAAQRDFTILSKDSDFYRMSVVLGAPPKVIWLRVGNDGTAAITALLRRSTGSFAAFESDIVASFLIVGK